MLLHSMVTEKNLTELEGKLLSKMTPCSLVDMSASFHLYIRCPTKLDAVTFCKTVTFTGSVFFFFTL